ncbi:MAG: hypothetical protein ACHQ6T_08475 [Myxococcota bacterium]
MPSARAGSAALSVAAALALLGGGPLSALAQSQTAQSRTDGVEAPPTSVSVVHALPPILIQISIARASKAEGTVEPAALDIYEHLPAKYHSISLLETRTVAVLLGEQAEVSLPNGSEVRLRPIAVHGGQLHLQFEMPDVLNTSMRLANNRAFYVGGPRLDKGTLVFKLVPEFAPYIDTSPPRTAAAPPIVDKASSSSKR